MTKTTPRHPAALILALILASLLCGCVVTGQMAERRGTKAYLLKDYPTAAANYQEAADDGDKDAQYHLAVMYAEGQGVGKDLAKAAGLLKRSADQGQTDAQLMLGLFNIYGDGVPADPEAGARLIARAAEAGSDVAMYYLGNLYAAGLGVEKDAAKGLYWMRQAREHGFPVSETIRTEADVEALYKD
ncbi:tetratricopeptide repeat protein [Pseudodesulfovibrio sp.]|uniref:tetratricopeptide repeat protein n=1 Tax=Pseudodesulfovibrio sp. TaxID=2035812 RepID=UPI0026153CE7|nr:tetratricopeptide repeat protein [Pseudodesulfovibrio sp.]MDD3311240.1 tetratricopeptide repeat protein [Pseudodesulfovibrio sp.]